MDSFLIQIAIFFSYYIIGAYSTTDILRFTRFYNHTITDGKCFCPSCDHELKLIDQIPLISYIFQRGRCKYCGSKIPRREFLCELLIFLLSSIITFLFHFNYLAWILNGCIYQIIKICIIIKYGSREKCTLKNIISSLLFNLLEFSLLGVLYLFAYIQIKFHS